MHKCLHGAEKCPDFREFFPLEIKPNIREVLEKCGNTGTKPTCGIFLTIAGRLTPIMVFFNNGFYDSLQSQPLQDNNVYFSHFSLVILTGT